MARIALRGRKLDDFWVYPKIDIEREVRVTLLIRVGMIGEPPRELSAQSISAEFVALNGLGIQPISRPDGPLIPFGGPGLHVNATFTFTDVARAARSLNVQIGDVSALFPLTDTVDLPPEEFTTPPRDGDRFPPSRGWWERIINIVRDIIGLFSKRCCVRTFDIPANRNPVNNAAKMTEAFDMNATFSDRRRCRCRCCEYRQFVRGQFTQGGVPQDHDLANGPLDVTIYREDGIADHWGPGKPIRYGHRDDPEFANDRYTPKRVDGCEYSGHDEPGWHVKAPGIAYTVDLEFWGAIIDVCRRRVIRSTTWRVQLP